VAKFGSWLLRFRTGHIFKGQVANITEERGHQLRRGESLKSSGLFFLIRSSIRSPTRGLCTV